MGKLARDGSEALTFRAVAREMNIAVGAFSRYFKSLAELEDEIAARIISTVAPPVISGEKELREEFLRLCMDWLKITRTYPALVNFGGPTSTTVLSAHVGQVVKVMTGAGIEMERAVLIYGMVINLAYAWGAQSARQPNKKTQKQSTETFAREVGGLTPRVARLLEEPDTEIACRQSFILLVDGLLPPMPLKKAKTSK